MILGYSSTLTDCLCCYERVESRTARERRNGKKERIFSGGGVGIKLELSFVIGRHSWWAGRLRTMIYVSLRF
jgi:hypothetical protein